MKKRILKKSEVLREGYVKGLKKAQRIINEQIENSAGSSVYYRAEHCTVTMEEFTYEGGASGNYQEDDGWFNDFTFTNAEDLKNKLEQQPFISSFNESNISVGWFNNERLHICYTADSEGWQLTGQELKAAEDGLKNCYIVDVYFDVVKVDSNVDKDMIAMFGED